MPNTLRMEPSSTGARLALAASGFSSRSMSTMRDREAVRPDSTNRAASTRLAGVIRLTAPS